MLDLKVTGQTIAEDFVDAGMEIIDKKLEK